MSSRLSISRAWDETKARLAADGRLYLTVALAMIALPTAVGQFATSGAGTTRAPQSAGELILMIAVWLIGLVGQLALVRLALGPSVSVGEAIGHGVRRAPVYIGAVILLILGVLLLSIPFVAVLAAIGVTYVPGAVPPPSAYFVFLLFLIVLLFIAVRMMLTSPVASEERAGPLAIIRRSWELTRGNALRLFGFLILFVIGVIIVVAAISIVINLIVAAFAGAPEPQSAGALIVALVEAVASAAATAVFVVMLARIYAQLAGADAVEVTVPSSGT